MRWIFESDGRLRRNFVTYDGFGEGRLTTLLPFVSGHMPPSASG
jgi:hypothetical protein